MLLARRYRNDFLLLLLWWFPLGDIEQRKSTLVVAGKIQVSFRAKDTGCEKLSSSGIIQYNSVVNSMYLTTPSFMLPQCLTPHSAAHCTTSASDRQLKKIKSNPPPSINGELLQKAIRGFFFPQEIASIVSNSGMFVEIHQELLFLATLHHFNTTNSEHLP